MRLLYEEPLAYQPFQLMGPDSRYSSHSLRDFEFRAVAIKTGAWPK